MTMTRRPRVAAIGLDDQQLASVEFLCGELRSSDSVSDYLDGYSWTETDVLLSSALEDYDFDSSVNFMTIGTTDIYWGSGVGRDFAFTDGENTERELAIPSSCPETYRSLAAELSRQLGRASEPPDVFKTNLPDRTALVETTSGLAVALRLVLPVRTGPSESDQSRPTGLLLPAASNLVSWFRAFLADLNESDPGRVPQAPPRLSEPSDWYTPKERALASRISDIDCDLQRLSDERDQLEAELTAAGEEADGHKRRALWADGRELVAAAQDILSELGFAVRDMDEELNEDEPKREDLRLTLSNRSAWEAIVEVKGYTSGTRTNDARQIREHQKRYRNEEGRYPDLTLWLCNPFRTMDEPSSRPAPDSNVKEAAEIAEAVHVLASDLYRRWALVASGCLESKVVVQSLVNAEPGLWTPPASGSST